MEHLLENFLALSLEKNKTTYNLKKGVEPVYCSSTNLEGDLCQNDAYWRWSEEDYCDRHLPLEGRMLFFLNDWTMTKDKEYEFESDSDDSSSSESESESSLSSESDHEPESDSDSLNTDELEFSDHIDLGPDMEIKSDLSDIPEESDDQKNSSP